MGAMQMREDLEDGLRFSLAHLKDAGPRQIKPNSVNLSQRKAFLHPSHQLSLGIRSVLATMQASMLRTALATEQNNQ